MINLLVSLASLCLALQNSAPPAANAHANAIAELVGFADLTRQLEDPRLRLLDARPKAEYDKGHIPGAVWVDVKAAEKLAARPGGLTDRRAWEKWIEPLGIGAGAETRVLVYDAKRQLDAARIWWLLSYLGVERVGLVNGGFALWKKEMRPVSTEVPRAERQPFPIQFRSNRLAMKSDVLEALNQGKTQVIDARSEAEYTGAQKKSKRGGRIPSACSLEWNKFVDRDGRFLDEPALRALLAQAGVAPRSPVITHCQGGGRASVDAFVFERLGFPTRNYYLGWSDWGNAEGTPVETGAAKAAR